MLKIFVIVFFWWCTKKKLIAAEKAHTLPTPVHLLINLCRDVMRVMDANWCIYTTHLHVYRPGTETNRSHTSESNAYVDMHKVRLGHRNTELKAHALPYKARFWTLGQEWFTLLPTDVGKSLAWRPVRHWWPLDALFSFVKIKQCSCLLEVR